MNYEGANSQGGGKGRRHNLGGAATPPYRECPRSKGKAKQGFSLRSLCSFVAKIGLFFAYFVFSVV
jgi:hypothetical protein